MDLQQHGSNPDEDIGTDLASTSQSQALEILLAKHVERREIENAVYSLNSQPLSSMVSLKASSDPTQESAQEKCLREHLEAHRSMFCGVEALAAAALRYVSDIYPFGDLHARDCTLTATAVLAFFTGNRDVSRTTFSPVPLANAPCPWTEAGGAWVHYISLTRVSSTEPLETCCGHRLVVVQAKGRARVLQACKGQFTLGMYMQRTGSMDEERFRAWWGTLQSALALSQGTERQVLFKQLLGVEGLEQPIDQSWMSTFPVNTGL